MAAATMGGLAGMSVVGAEGVPSAELSVNDQELMKVILTCSDLSQDGRRQYFREVAREAASNDGSKTALAASEPVSSSQGSPRFFPSGSEPRHSDIDESSAHSEAPTAHPTEATSQELTGEGSSCAALSGRDSDPQDVLAAIRQERADREKVCCFLEQHGFGGIGARRRRLLSGGAFTLPLHRAAATNNAEAVRLLLQARASCHQTDGRGRTALQLAQQKDRRGTHAETIVILKNAECSHPGLAWSEATCAPTLVQSLSQQRQAVSSV